MIKTLRFKFIAIAMISIALVLILIIGGINIANYANINQSTNMRLEIIAENDGTFPQKLNGEEFIPDNKLEKPSDNFHDTEIEEAEKKNPPSDMNNFHFQNLPAEAAFDTRYFTVTLQANGTIAMVNTGKISAISTEDASKFATSLFGEKETAGFIENYKFIAKPLENNKIMYIFLDCERELNTFYSFLFASIAVSLAGLFLVFILVLIFSKIIVKPVAESYEKQKRFITDASHEIKTPLTIIDANTEVLEMVNGENEWTKSTRNQINRLTRLTEKLVFLSRMDEENSVMEMADFSLSDAVCDTAEPFLAVAATKNRNLTLSITPDIFYHGNEGALRQVISLLLDNAMKYSNEGGEICLSLEWSGKNRILKFYNTVESIELGNKDILFERFYRADDSRSTKTGGYGIGLSVVKAIVLSHKGKVTAHSRDNHSIEFTIQL